MYSEQPISGLLGQSVECCWHTSGGNRKDAVLPDGCVDIIYSSTAGLFVVGAMTKERVFEIPAEARLTGVRFRPGMARPFLGAPGITLSVAELTDVIVPLEDLCGRSVRETLSRLDDASSSAARSALLQNLLQPIENKNSVQRALEYAVAHHGVVDLDWMVRQANLSQRQFRRRCLDESGLTPKRLCRILRFRRARTLALASHRPNWADIAASTGYCDQAHLVRDFHEFAGRTPMSVLSNRQSG